MFRRLALGQSYYDIEPRRKIVFCSLVVGESRLAPSGCDGIGSSLCPGLPVDSVSAETVETPGIVPKFGRSAPLTNG
ncbi:hypothetical protein HSB1_39730 [Halogranum salarium B-1]|uniref:Uncharacterized protein n=1 Tax=Halogranum salarium B-1 TaxID=1210908 RepID=J3ETS4_9EURY|nr:hypothetical protein HSB1_39730 [Halogranum salarium B-1]